MRTISIFGVTLFLVGISLAEIRQVPQTYQTITAAVNASSPGDTILVSPGLYSERIPIVQQTVTVASLYLLTGDSLYRDQTIVSLPDSLRDTLYDNRSVIDIRNHSNVHVVGLTIRNGFGTRYRTSRYRYGGGVFIDSSIVSINFCRITNNESQYGGGVGSLFSKIMFFDNRVDSCFGVDYFMGGGCYFFRSDTIVVQNTLFTLNRHEGVGGGLAIASNGGFGEVADCEFVQNETEGQAGAAFLTGCRVLRNVFINNRAPTNSGVILQGVRNVDTTYLFADNRILGNSTPPGEFPSGSSGVFIDMYTDPDSSGYLVRGNSFENNFSLHEGGALAFQRGRHYVTNNRFYRNSAPLSSVFVARQRAVVYFDSNRVEENVGGVGIFVWLTGALNARNNDFINNSGQVIAVGSLSEGMALATDNWWGMPSGPSCAENPGGMGDSIGTGIPFTPWRTTPVFNTAISSPALTTQPLDHRLLTIFPNPSNGAVTIRLSLPQSSHETALQIWDRTGRKVTELHRGSLAGTTTEWKYRNDRLASGKYYIMVESTEIPGPYLVPFTLIK